jgi:hypothetical protein
MLPVKRRIIRQNIRVMVGLHKSGRCLVRQPHLAISLTSLISWNVWNFQSPAIVAKRTHGMLLVHQRGVNTGN